jgi:L-fucose mutarotase/ribose pyranase (RbsD/FucU family)
MLSWFNTAPSLAFAKELAQFILSELDTQQPKPAAATSKARNKDEAKFTAKAQRTLEKAAKRLQAFKAKQSLNFYKKSKLANAFLWELKDGGCPQAYADELTEWLTLRL